ncbi:MULTISPECIES: sensor histidine kinase [unclassified Paenibacillus]|uniref:sensor histidine kinase n=1 Tax=unclassified Paenibacillus TaxID=185978 RepID=UPI002F3F8028
MKRKIRFHFKDLRLRTKFLVSFVGLIFLFLLVNSILNYYVSINSIQKISEQHSTLLLDQIAQNFEQKMQELEELSFVEYKNAAFCKVITDKKADQTDDVLKAQSIKQFIYKMVYANDIIPYAAVYEPDGKMYSQLRTGYPVQPVLAGQTLTFKEMEALDYKRGKPVWEGGDSKLIFLKRAMYDLNSSVYCGSLVIGVESSYFKSIYPSSEGMGEIMFANRDDELIIYNSSFSQELFEAASAREDNTFYHHKNKYIFIEHTTTDETWKLLNIVSLEQFTSYMKPLRFWAILIFVAAFAAAFINIAFLTKSITKQLHVLVNSMKALSVGALDTVIQTEARDEIGIIAEKFNQMAATIKELIHTASQEKLQKERAVYKQLESEYKALQAQMNPHFLYNTLETIHSAAKINQQHEIGQMIYLLGRLIRESISRKQDFIPLADEIDFIRDYLTLQGITYESRLQVDYEIEAESLDCIVPKFILQPIVENAIMHGIEMKSGIGTILIRCYIESDILVMIVEDNGVGMSQEVIDELLSSEPDETVVPNPERTRVGLRSIHRRVQLLFGEAYGITIQSIVNQGTSIMIRQPVKTEEGIKVGNEGRSS